MEIHNYIISTTLYLTFSKHDDKLLVVKILANILEYACWRIKACGNCIKVCKISPIQMFIPVIHFLIKKMVKKGITGMRVLVELRIV